MGKVTLLAVCLATAVGLSDAQGRERLPLRPDRAGTRISLATQPRIELPAVSSAELVRGSAMQALPIASEQEIVGGLVETLTRQIPAMWEMSVPAGTSIDRLEIVYDLVSASGRRQRLSAGAADGHGLAVRIRPLPSIIVSEDENRAIVRGGALLELDVSLVRRAGRYSGSLQVAVIER